MGNKQFQKDKCGSGLRQAITRMNMHRQKKLNANAKLKDEICKHLSAEQEVNAKIWCETLINDENLIPCYDVVSTMCDQIRGRLEYISKFGAPPDMSQTFATIIHAAPKLNVEELMEVRNQLSKLLGKEFTLQADEQKEFINPVVADNIDFKKPLDGHVIYRLRQLAKERNISYEPTHDMMFAMNSYLELKGLQDPMGGSGAPLSAPVQYMPQQYNPPPGGPPPGGFNPGGGMPPPGDNQFPPAGGPPGGGGGMMMPPPMYDPNQQMPHGMPPQMPPQMPSQMPPSMPPHYIPPPGQVPPAMNMPTYHQIDDSAKPDPQNQPAQNNNVAPGLPVGESMDDLEARLRALEGK